MIPVPARSATVTKSPPKLVRFRVLPFSVKRIGNVAVVPVGIASAMFTVRYPTGEILRKPRAKSTVSVPTVMPVVRKYGIPFTLVLTEPNMASRIRS